MRAPCPNKDAKIVCVIANNEDTDPPHLLNALLVLAMIIKENCIPTRMHVSSNRPVSEDEDDVFSWRSFAPVVQ